MTGVLIVSGTASVRVICPDPGDFLRKLNCRGVPLWDVVGEDPLTVSFTARGKDRRLLEETALQAGGRLQWELKKPGFLGLLSSVGQRPVLILGVVALMLLTLFLPGRILFIRVEGNTTVGSRQILDAAREEGLSFGADRRRISSEDIKNRLLSQIPRLQWVGVNTRGCTATVTVRERLRVSGEDIPSGVRSLVASRDGILETVTVTRGTALCAVGQAVTEGQVLISGYTDCGLTLRAEWASGEVFAKTVHPVSLVMPLECLQKGDVTGSYKKISVIFGKKRINLWKDSGISGTTCDKIARQYTLMLPGGFQLPVTLVVEEWRRYEGIPGYRCPEEGRQLLYRALEAQVKGETVSGRILDTHLEETASQQLLALRGSCLCSEMIARERREEIIEEYGKDSGTGSER